MVNNGVVQLIAMFGFVDDLMTENEDLKILIVCFQSLAEERFEGEWNKEQDYGMGGGRMKLCVI